MNVKDLIARLTDLRETLADGGKSIYQKVLAVFDFLIYLRPALPTAGPAVMGAAAANNPLACVDAMLEACKAEPTHPEFGSPLVEANGELIKKLLPYLLKLLPLIFAL